MLLIYVLHTLGVHTCNYLSHNKLSYLLLEGIKKIVCNRTVQEGSKALRSQPRKTLQLFKYLGCVLPGKAFT